MQLRAVAVRHGWSVVAEYIDHGISGAKSREQRPQFDALLHGVTRREFDMIAALDTSTPMGKTMFQLCGVFAELERSIIQERVKAGLERARAKGKTLGRPRTDPRTEARIRDLASRGMGKGKIARTLGIGVSVAQRVLAAPI